MKYKVLIKAKNLKKIEKLPKNVQQIFLLLKEELKELGAIRNNWKNYSKLSEYEYHCHLTYRYVACWKVNKNNEIEIEVYYVGSREKAPY